MGGDVVVLQGEAFDQLVILGAEGQAIIARCNGVGIKETVGIVVVDEGSRRPIHPQAALAVFIVAIIVVGTNHIVVLIKGRYQLDCADRWIVGKALFQSSAVVLENGK